MFSSVFLHAVHTRKKPLHPYEAFPRRSVSITGQPLNSSVSAVFSFSFPESEFLYETEFLVCDNVLPTLDCVLGWDFLTFYSLQLTALEGSYCLVGPHGCTPLTPLSPPADLPPQSFSASANPSPREEMPVFV